MNPFEPIRRRERLQRAAELRRYSDAHRAGRRTEAEIRRALQVNDDEIRALLERSRRQRGRPPESVIAERRRYRARRPDFESRARRRGGGPAQIELRSASDGSALLFDGYASLTDVSYQVFDHLGEFTETVRSGAFASSLADQADVVLLANHEGIPLARTKSGTMRLSEDARGLHVNADLEPRSSIVNNLRHAMARGDLDQMSFAFRCVHDEWNEDYTRRDVFDVALRDVSIVTFPASDSTTASITA